MLFIFIYIIHIYIFICYLYIYMCSSLYDFKYFLRHPSRHTSYRVLTFKTS